MFVIAIETELGTLASCAETNVMTRNGYQIITENEAFFVSKERFLNKYKGNLYVTPGIKDRLLSFEEAYALRDSVRRLEASRLIRVKGSHKQESFTKDGARYQLNLPSSDVEINAAGIFCEYSGGNSNVRIVTDGSTIEATASNSTFDVTASNTVITMYVNGSYIDLSGHNLEVVIIGSNNTVCGVSDGITVFSRGRKNEFQKRIAAPEEDTSKTAV